jgi:hypothetical protein
MYMTQLVTTYVGGTSLKSCFNPQMASPPSDLSGCLLVVPFRLSSRLRHNIIPNVTQVQDSNGLSPSFEITCAGSPTCPIHCRSSVSEDYTSFREKALSTISSAIKAQLPRTSSSSFVANAHHMGDQMVGIEDRSSYRMSTPSALTALARRGLC